MSVLFETGELNAYVYDGGGLYRRKYVRTEGKGKTTTITLADGKLPCIATRGYQRHTSGPHDVPLLVDRLAVEAGLLLWFLAAKTYHIKYAYFFKMVTRRS